MGNWLADYADGEAGWVIYPQGSFLLNTVVLPEWFKAQAQSEFIAKRARLAEAERVDPQEIPEWQVRTILQRTVQVLKLHRNEFFADDPDFRPASILLTTLAAQAYRGEVDLYEAVVGTVERIATSSVKGSQGAAPMEMARAEAGRALPRSIRPPSAT